eukprot:Pgem_evm1s20150
MFPHNNFPRLPKKRIFGNNLDPEFIELRKHGLHEYLQNILNHDVWALSPPVLGFLLDGGMRVKKVDEDLGDEDGDGNEIEPRINLGETERKEFRVSDFLLIKCIGKGSFGKVLLAKQKNTNNVYAIKVLAKKAIKQKNEVQHIMAERNVLLKNLKHPFL